MFNDDIDSFYDEDEYVYDGEEFDDEEDEDEDEYVYDGEEFVDDYEEEYYEE